MSPDFKTFFGGGGEHQKTWIAMWTFWRTPLKPFAWAIVIFCICYYVCISLLSSFIALYLYLCCCSSIRPGWPWPLWTFTFTPRGCGGLPPPLAQPSEGTDRHHGRAQVSAYRRDLLHDAGTVRVDVAALPARRRLQVPVPVWGPATHLRLQHRHQRRPRRRSSRSREHRRVRR